MSWPSAFAELLPVYVLCPSLPGNLAASRAGVSLLGPALPCLPPLSASNPAHESPPANSNPVTISSHACSLPSGTLVAESLLEDVVS